MALVIKQVLSFVTILVLVSCSSEPAALRPDAPVLSIAGGEVIGQRSQDGRTESFLGVPFAQPPVGDLRWAPPVPLIGMEGRFQATSFAPACMQTDHITQWYRDVVTGFGGDPNVVVAPEVSEDCLYLNIWRPVRDSIDSALPVIVYFHGGSNKGGWSFEPNYIGHHLAAKGAIVISISYRLSVLGFFSHPALDHANFGLLDQIAALKWINANSESLGGDSDRIVLMGESAGANNIGQLLTMSESNGLFSRIIHQSGGSFMTERTKRETMLKVGQEFASRAVGSEDDDVLFSMRQISPDKLVALANEVFKNYYFDPVIDGLSVSKSIVDVILSGEMHPVDVLIGTNDDEWLMDLPSHVDAEVWLSEHVPEPFIPRLRELLNEEINERRKVDLLETAKHYVCPSLAVANQAAKMGKKTWVYLFTRQRQGDMAATMGAYHGAELPYIFDTHDDWLPTVEDDLILTEKMQQYWINFAVSGNPNQPDLTEWPRYTNEQHKLLSLGDNMQTISHPSEPLCDLLGPALPLQTRT